MHTRVPCWLVASVLAGLSACEVVERPSSVPTHARYADRITGFGLDRTLLGKRWREAAARALREPTRIVLPHAEQGALLAHEAGALGFVFEAAAGQTLEIELAREAVTDAPGLDDGRIYIDVFRIAPAESGTRYERVGDASVEGLSLHIPVPETADYVVRIQPELLVNTLYGLTLELGPALPFPVDGQSTSAVHSFFGDDRDAGARLHEGVDIFAERMTPVRAVTDGRVVPSRNDLGGNVVWLNTPGRSYYYAHLERPAVNKSRRVKAGDVIGYVGNSGNASATPPHLHFGIYRWGRGAVDPFPELVARRLPDGAEPTGRFEPRLASTDADRLNLRAGPSVGAPVLAQLPNGTIVSVRGKSGDWLRVDDSTQRGWIHSVYERPLEPAGESLQVEARLAPILDAAGPPAQPLAVLERGDRYDVLGSSGGRSIVRASRGLLAGWLAEPL